MTTTWPRRTPHAAATPVSSTSATTCSSMKWLPAPRLPSCVRPRSIALREAASALAPGTAPDSSVCATSRSAGQAALDEPGHAALDDLRELARRHRQRPAVVGPLRNAPHEPVHDLFGARAHFIFVEPRRDETHAAVDVEADTAGRDDTVVHP